MVVDFLNDEYRPRLVDVLLDELTKQLSALLVLGPRACGKTTTLQRRARTVVRLDSRPRAAVFEADPDAALRGLPEPVLIDEWQHVPGVLGAVRRAVEADNRPNRYFVTGSVRAHLEHEVWPATGRLVRVAMHPMTVGEQLGLQARPLLQRLAEHEEPCLPSQLPDLRGYIELALRGGFPDVALRLTGPARLAWLESYIADLVGHDVEQVEDVARRRDTERLRLFLEAYALVSAGVVQQKTLYEAAGITKATATVYEELLGRLLIAERVPAWSTNRLKRLVRNSKRYLVDASLLAASAGLDEGAVLEDGDLLGRVLDTFVAAQLRPELALSRPQAHLFHLRTEGGRHEVDLLAERAGRQLVAIEVKASASPGREHARHLAWLRDELGERFLAGVVLHTGPGLYRLGERILAAPIATLWA
ncbi:MAG: ATP-binding protein [Solirubrobacteraceae bacterium]